MRRPRMFVSPTIDVLESRTLMSTASPHFFEHVLIAPERLAPSGQSDIVLDRSHSARSVIATEALNLGDIFRHIQVGIFHLQGRRGPHSPLPSLSLDSVQIMNTTPWPILVTIHLQSSPPPMPINQTVGYQTTLPFDFMSATDAKMTMDVSRPDTRRRRRR